MEPLQNGDFVAVSFQLARRSECAKCGKICRRWGTQEQQTLRAPSNWAVQHFFRSPSRACPFGAAESTVSSEFKSSILASCMNLLTYDYARSLIQFDIFGFRREKKFSSLSLYFRPGSHENQSEGSGELSSFPEDLPDGKKFWSHNF